jgi:hypothetical protein
MPSSAAAVVGSLRGAVGMSMTAGKRSKVEWKTSLDVRGQLTELFGEIFSKGEVEGRDGELRVGVMGVMGQICTSEIGSQSMTMSSRDAKYGVAGRGSRYDVKSIVGSCVSGMAVICDASA